MNQHGIGGKFYNAREALEYLRIRWKMPEYSMDAFRQYRHRKKYIPTFKGIRESGWTQEDLDTMEKPKKGGGRPKGSSKKRVVKGEIQENEEKNVQCERT